jgi:hypothetical protein
MHSQPLIDACDRVQRARVDSRRPYVDVPVARRGSLVEHCRHEGALGSGGPVKELEADTRRIGPLHDLLSTSEPINRLQRR